MAPLAALFVLLAWPAAAFPSCENQAALNEAVNQGLQSFLSKNACVSGGAVAELKKLFPQGLPKAVVDSLRDSAGASVGRRRGLPAAPASKDGKSAGDEFVPYDPETLNLVTVHLYSLLGKTITVECAPITAAAEWAHDPNCDRKNSVCGSMRFNEGTLKLMQGNLRSNSESALRAEDQFGNTVVHELFHAVVSFTQNMSGNKSAFEAGSPRPQRFLYFKHWNGCEPEGKQVQYQLDWIGYSACALCNEDSARKVGHRVNMCSPQTVGRILGLESSSCTPPTERELSAPAPAFR